MSVLNNNCDITYQQPIIKWEMLRTVIFENPSVVTKMSESKKDTNQDIDSNQCSEAKFLSEKKNRIVGDYPEIDILSEMFAIRDMILYLLQPKVKNSYVQPSKCVQRTASQSAVISNMGHPKITKQIASEGKCLFRAIADAISDR